MRTELTRWCACVHVHVYARARVQGVCLRVCAVPVCVRPARIHSGETACRSMPKAVIQTVVTSLSCGPFTDNLLVPCCSFLLQVRENIPDPADAEQTWPTDEDMAAAAAGGGASLDPPTRRRRVPEGACAWRVGTYTCTQECVSCVAAVALTVSYGKLGGPIT
jgi:hypothetical protein